MTAAQEMAESIEQAWGDFVSRDRRPAAPHRYVYASQFRPCLRRMVYDCTCPGEQAPPDADLQARFRRANDRARDLLIDAARVGRDSTPPFQVVAQEQRFEVKDRRDRVIIVGKIDAQLVTPEKTFDVELKAWSPFITERLHTFEDVLANP